MKHDAAGGDTLVSVLIECGIVNQQTILGALAERGGGETWLADHLVKRGIVTSADMNRVLELIKQLRSSPFQARRARVEMVKFRIRQLGHAHTENIEACDALQQQSERISDEFPDVRGLVKVDTGD